MLFFEMGINLYSFQQKGHETEHNLPRLQRLPFAIHRCQN